jgi:hypothetical protein
MAFWKAFNELTVGIAYGIFIILYIMVLVKAIPSIIQACKDVIKANK